MVKDIAVGEAVGYISYEWKGAPSGVIDAYAGGTALIGFDEAIRFFNRKQIGGLPTTSYEIPVRTIGGSWVLVLLGLLAIPTGAFVTGYAKKAGEKMAERDFSEVGFSDVARRSIEALERLVELVKHTRKTVGWASNALTWNDNATIVGVINDDGEVLYIPVEYLKWYLDLPRSTLKKLVAPVAAGRHMVVASRDTDGLFRKVEVHQADVGIFLGEAELDDEDFLFPELVHGEEMHLEGVITRGNQETNSMGFLFRNHILNCQPDTGSVRRFKRAMFLHCKVRATIHRHVASRVQSDRRPTLIVHEVEILEADGQTALFEGG